MGIRRKKSSEWTDATVLRRYTGSEWVDVATSRRYNGTEWVPLWRPAGTYTKSYYPAEYASYYVTSSERILSLNFAGSSVIYLSPIDVLIMASASSALTCPSPL